MPRHLLARAGGLGLLVSVLVLASLTTSCGGGGGYAAKDMVLVEFLFVDRALVPTAPTGTQNLPRNAQVLMVFSEKVDPKSVTDQTIQIRYGPTAQSVPAGSFSVDGNTVRFDPTVTAQGQPNPFGFQPVTQYLVDVPNYEEQNAVVRNLDRDPNLVTFFTTFVTSDGFLREFVPPEVVKVYSIPDRFEKNPLTGQWPGDGTLAVEFTEPMDPATFSLGGGEGPDPFTTIDVRYLASEQINIDNGLVNASGIGKQVPGYIEHDASARIYEFHPTFSFGDKKFVFAVQVFQGLQDLSGNLLINPRSFGPFTVDGTGMVTGITLEETFDDTANEDFASTDAEWKDGTLRGQPITTRETYIWGYTFVDQMVGQYGPVISPLVGAALNQYQSNVTPATSLGRRAMWTFKDTEIGPDGTLTGAGWGPDSNATFAAIYPSMYLRCGYQKSDSLSLAASFAGNYDGEPTVLYTGSYQVPQKANVGNVPPAVSDTCAYSVGGLAPCYGQPCWNSPLYDYTGFQPWPSFSTYFEWTEGDPQVENDRVFLFDASVSEGDTWQQLRSWFAMTYPCSGLLITGFPNRRMYTTFEGDEPNPPSNFGAGTLNPEPSITDSTFTITKRISLAQTLFWTDVAQPNPSAETTFPLQQNDFLKAQLTPTVQQGGALVIIEFQACDLVEADRRTINQAGPFMADWSRNIDECDGYANIRWRIFLISNLISNTRASLTSVVLPIVQL